MPDVRRPTAHSTLRRVASVAALVVVGTVLAGCATRASPPEPPEASAPVDAVRMAVVGDSITAADSEHLAGGMLGAQSWVSYAVGEDVAFAGGWAQWGARTAQMADGIAEPFDADVLVILAGTNDAYADDLDAEIGAHLVRIAERAGVDEIVLSSIPPLEPAPDRAEAVNAFLEPFAEQQGWIWVDATAGLRDGDGFAPGTSYDGVHLTEAGARIVGGAIADAVLDAR